MRTLFKRILFALFVISITFGGISCAGGGRANKTSSIRGSTQGQLGYVLPKYNFSIDAEYSTEVALVIPGYTAITVAIANKSLKAIKLRPDKDRWRIKDRKGKAYNAINEIQYEAPQAWNSLHPEARRMMEYPMMVPPGYTQTFEVFFPGELDLSGFREIQYYNEASGKTFTFSRY